MLDMRDSTNNIKKEKKMDIANWICVGVLAIILIAFFVYYLIKFFKLSPEKRKELIKTYLKGLISYAEENIIGTKMGAERLKYVEDYFNKNAPFVLKILLLVTCKDSLEELIEEALAEIKGAFEK